MMMMMIPRDDLAKSGNKPVNGKLKKSWINLLYSWLNTEKKKKKMLRHNDTWHVQW
jgi:hypothetical protein